MRCDIETVNLPQNAKAMPHASIEFLPHLPMPEDLPPEPIAISDMANLFGVTHRTLHFYEEKQLLSSSRMGLMRVYYHRDIRRMALINTCRETGMPIAAIQELLTVLSDATTQAEANAVLNAALEERKRELVASQSTMLRQMRQINALMAQHDEDDKEPSAKQLPEVHLTELEHQCLMLMAEGYTQIRLARTMQMTPDAVQSVEVSIMRKINASNRFQAVAKAVLLGLIAS